MKKLLKSIARIAGIEIRRYSPERSDSARIQRIFAHHSIDVVLDVGANIGQYAQYLRWIGYAGRIVSFEPLSCAYSTLISASKNDPLWDIAPRAAIGDRDGEIAINISKNSVCSSLLPILDSHLNTAPNSKYIATETVKLHKLETIASRYIENKSESIYLKVDVQGYEMNVLDGAAGILPRIKGIQMELSLVPLYHGELLFKGMLDKMDRLGYELYALIPGFSDNQSGRLLQVDGIFFRKEPASSNSADPGSKKS